MQKDTQIFGKQLEQWLRLLYILGIQNSSPTVVIPDWQHGLVNASAQCEVVHSPSPASQFCC